MPNPFFTAMSGAQGQPGGTRNHAPNLLQFIQGFKGNPIEEVQGKLKSGEWSQEQYNEVRKAAEQVARQMIGLFRR